MRVPRLPALAALAVFALGAVDARADEPQAGWRWTSAPYLWGTGLDGTVGIGPAESKVDLDFSDVLDHLDMGLMMRLEGQGPRWGLSFDAGYVKLSQNTSLGDSEAISKQVTVELDATYAFNPHFSLLAGARYWDLDNELDFTAPALPDPRATESWVDPVVGFVALAELSESWDFRFRGDLGGFGAGSDFTWQAEALFLWHATEKFSLAFGYRILDVDYEDGAGAERFLFDAQQRGLEVGFALHF